MKLSDLKGDPQNPRKIGARAAERLRGSLRRYGDLAGITFNRRTGELVTGHQRMAQIRRQWPEASVVRIADDAALIVVDAARAFAVRIVDWSPARQRAANVTANNPKIRGEFTEDVRSFLMDVQAELDIELPGVADRVRLVEWMAPDVDDAAGAQDVETLYQVVAYCDGEEAQNRLAAELVGRGLKATAVIG